LPGLFGLDFLHVKGSMVRIKILDPQTLPFVSLAHEGAVPSEKMSLSSLHLSLRDVASFAGEVGDQHLLTLEQVLKPAAVLILIVQRASGDTVLFTRRAVHLHDHAGQISFPGGRVEATD
jgi:hypothetical protein